jgi:hypothetical protein
LQALVWGGKLESISMPEPGSSNALVKFLTPEACEKYHKDTVNGIEVLGDMKKAVVFVEKAEGPNSINDVIRNCIDGDASRCVRAIGASEHNEIALMKLARGKSATKRDVDRIKSGKTARGVSDISPARLNNTDTVSLAPVCRIPLRKHLQRSQLQARTCRQRGLGTLHHQLCTRSV